MSSRALEDLLRRRAVLRGRSTALRSLVALQLTTLQSPFALADRAAGVATWLRDRPWLFALPVVGLAAWRPNRLLGWALRAFTVTRALRQVGAALRPRH